MYSGLWTDIHCNCICQDLKRLLFLTFACGNDIKHFMHSVSTSLIFFVEFGTHLPKFKECVCVFFLGKENRRNNSNTNLCRTVKLEPTCSLFSLSFILTCFSVSYLYKAINFHASNPNPLNPSSKQKKWIILYTLEIQEVSPFSAVHLSLIN